MFNVTQQAPKGKTKHVVSLRKPTSKRKKEGWNFVLFSYPLLLSMSIPKALSQTSRAIPQCLHGICDWVCMWNSDVYSHMSIYSMRVGSIFACVCTYHMGVYLCRYIHVYLAWICKCLVFLRWIILNILLLFQSIVLI